MTAFPSPHKDDAEGSTGLIFMRVFNKWHGEIKRQLKAIGITHPQFVLLTTIGYLSQSEREITQVMVASMAGMDVMSVSQVLALLEKKGWVSRAPHPRDSRANCIALTPDGHAKMIAALPIVEEIDRAFFCSLGENQPAFNALLGVLKQFQF